MQVETTSDVTLIEAACRGDQAAFGQIVERYQHAVYAVAFATTRDRSLADDVAQDAFVAAWRMLGELRDAGRLPAWLCGIARNRARETLLRRRRQEARDAHVVAATANVQTPYEMLSDAESERIFLAALDAVPATYREPLVLFYLEQQSVEDVAHALGIDPRTTNKRLSRGRQQLAARVGELVERGIRMRGPHTGFVACVLAAISVIGSTSRVDASPSVKGSTMLKFAVPVTLLAVAAGTFVLAGSPSTTAAPATSASAAHAATATTSATAPKIAPANPAPTTHGSPAPTAAAPTAPTRVHPPPQLAEDMPSIPDCSAVAHHLAEAMLTKIPMQKQIPADKLQQIVATWEPEFLSRCTSRHWSDDQRVCLMSAADSRDQMACTQDNLATADEVAKLPPELQCDALGKHQAALAIAPGAKFDIVIKKAAASGIKFDAAKIAEDVRIKTRDDCDGVPWPVEIRSCVAKGKTLQETQSCW